MSIGLYFDHTTPDPIAHGLRRRGVDVLLAREDGASRLMDESMLERVATLGRVVFTHDDDFLSITKNWERQGRSFGGVAYIAQGRAGYGELIEDLALIAEAYDRGQVQNQIFYLPFSKGESAD